MENRKVAIFYQGGSTYGGVERYIDQLVRIEGIDFAVISFGSWELTETLKSKGKRVIELDFRWYQLWKIFRLRDLIEKEGFELLISQVMVANFYSRLTSYLTKIPNLVVVHSDFEFDYPSGIKPFIYRCTEWLLKGLTDRYVAVSEHLAGKLIERGIDKNKITVVYNGVPDIGDTPKKKTADTIIGSIGRLHYTKGYHNLIEAYKYLEDSIKLMIWGVGEEEEGLKELAIRIGVKNRVTFVGFEKDLRKIFSAIDIYIQPSLSEGFGLSVVEAMMAGKPVIVTPNGSLPELIIDGSTGTISGDESPEALAASIKTVIADSESAAAMAKEAARVARAKYNLKDWVESTKRVIEEVLE